MLVKRRCQALADDYFHGTAAVNLGALDGFIEEMMEGQKVVKVFCHEEESHKAQFDEINDRLFESADNANKFAN